MYKNLFNIFTDEEQKDIRNETVFLSRDQITAK